jgi:hypothetical protein
MEGKVGTILRRREIGGDEGSEDRMIPYTTHSKLAAYPIVVQLCCVNYRVEVLDLPQMCILPARSALSVILLKVNCDDINRTLPSTQTPERPADAASSTHSHILVTCVWQLR